MNYLLFSNKKKKKRKENASDLSSPGFDFKIMVMTNRNNSWLASVAPRLQVRRDCLLA